MTRTNESTHNKVALLATGDEITNGDILNSNSQVIAQKLFKSGIQVGVHMTVADNISAIEQAIKYLLASHRALIITGGLGPTSDDLTRYAVSNAINQPLVFHAPTWGNICERFKILGYAGAPPEGNRQQALFPENAIIIPNINGTAAGCGVLMEEQAVFMLPGPPFECLPMVDTVVLPELTKMGCKDILFYDSWLLFGASEGKIAEELDAIAKPYNCMTGYRLAYPYIEFKIYSNHADDFANLVAKVNKTVAPYLISDGKQTASAMLMEKLTQANIQLSIQDTATGGLLENTIKTPYTANHLNFATRTTRHIELNGLKEFWSQADDQETYLEIRFSNGAAINHPIPLRGRGPRVKQYAMEFACKQIYDFIATNDTN